MGRENSNTISVLLNATAVRATTPSFATRIDFATGAQPRCLAISDLNGDGKPDVAIVNLASDTLEIFVDATMTGASVPSLAIAQVLPTGTTPTFVASADLNGDGKPDLVHTNQDVDTITIHLTP